MLSFQKEIFFLIQKETPSPVLSLFKGEDMRDTSLPSGRRIFFQVFPLKISPPSLFHSSSLLSFLSFLSPLYVYMYNIFLSIDKNMLQSNLLQSNKGKGIFPKSSPSGSSEDYGGFSPLFLLPLGG